MHTIIYSTGVGDQNIVNRQRLIGFWRYKNIRIRILPNMWKVAEPVETKLARLTAAIDEEFAKGNFVSLIGESAGASMVTQALQARTEKLTAVILLCGKSQYPEKLGSGYTSPNPTLRPSVEASVRAIARFTPEDKAKILNLHPFLDPIVPVKETKISGVKNSTMPVAGHATAIVFGMTIWSWKIAQFVRNRANKTGKV